MAHAVALGPQVVAVGRGGHGREPFDGKKLKAKSLDFREGKIFDVPDFVKFLQVPLKDRNAQGQLGALWIKDDYPSAWAKAVAQKKRLFLNFYGVSDTGALWNERNALESGQVVGELEKFVCVKLHIDIIPNSQLSLVESRKKAEQQIRMLLELTQSVASPAYIVFAPNADDAMKGDLPNGTVIGLWQGKIASNDDFGAFLREPTKRRS